MIELKNIAAGYSKHTVLENVSITFEKGQLTSIIGKNGCGKSTLLKAALGILPITGGEISLCGTPLNQMSRNGIAQKLSYLAQGKTAPDMTVMQMVLNGRFPHLKYPQRYSKNDIEIATASLNKMGITDLKEAALGTLSGGMQQKAYIAMALAQSTDYILLDEPTTYLDITHQLELMKILKSLAENGKGIITVMHDLPLALSVSDRIIVLDEKTIVADGTPQSVFESKTIEKIFGVSLEQSPDGNGYHYKY